MCRDTVCKHASTGKKKMCVNRRACRICGEKRTFHFPTLQCRLKCTCNGVCTCGKEHAQESGNNNNNNKSHKKIRLGKYEWERNMCKGTCRAAVGRATCLCVCMCTTHTGKRNSREIAAAGEAIKKKWQGDASDEHESKEQSDEDDEQGDKREQGDESVRERESENESEVAKEARSNYLTIPILTCKISSDSDSNGGTVT